jgi:cytochrome c556
MKLRLRSLVLVGSILCSTLVARAADDPKDVVRYRQQVMKAMGASLKSLSAIAKGDVSYRQHAKVHAQELAQLSQLMVDLFPEGTGPTTPRSEAKAEIWTKPEAFRAATKELEKETRLLLTAAEADDLGTLKSVLLRVNGSCSNCHHSFRVENEK